jgi:hypothetical protein
MTTVKPNIEHDDEIDDLAEECPKCGRKTLYSGYGMAGGGLGSYVYCANDDCAFFEKTQDRAVEDD